MPINEEQIRRFQLAYSSQYGFVLSFEEAEAKLSRLVTLFRILQATNPPKKGGGSNNHYLASS